jgi:hypothetical protein
MPLSKATIFFDDKVWQTFRKACIDRRTSASEEIRRLVQEQLVAWGEVPHKETDRV